MVAICRYNSKGGRSATVGWLDNNPQVSNAPKIQKTAVRTKTSPATGNTGAEPKRISSTAKPNSVPNVENVSADGRNPMIKVSDAPRRNAASSNPPALSRIIPNQPRR